jgi:hypothetical protein
MTIESTLAVQRAFGARRLTHHAGGPGVKRFQGNGHAIVHVMDPEVSRRILRSPDFVVANLFSPGLLRLAERGESLEWVQRFFDHHLLFQAGREHQQRKKSFHAVLKQAGSDLLASQADIECQVVKRRHRITSASAFSRQVVRVSVAWLVARLTGVPLTRSLRSVLLRSNVWLPYFHPARLRRLDRSFSVLYVGRQYPREGEPGWIEHLAAQSLLVDGLDPITGSMTASLVEGGSFDFVDDVHRFSPTGYVMRICVRACSIGGVAFREGDVCLTSLLPSGPPTATPAIGQVSLRQSGLAFGIGIHSCVGKSISLTILGIGERIYKANFPEGFPTASVLAPDGAFMGFREVR